MSQEIALTILFADLTGRQALAQTVGEAEAQQIFKHRLYLLADIVVECGGSVVKIIENELLATFETADRGIECACVMQTRLMEHTSESVVIPGLQIGVNFGNLIQEGGDIFGETVNVAARVVSMARAGQILATGLVVQRLMGNLRSNTRYIDYTPVRGRKEAITLYEVVWQMGGPSVAVTTFARPHLFSDRRRLNLRLGDISLEVSEERPTITLGRDLENDLIVMDRMASRKHALIEYSRGKFFLKDQSVNGTFVATSEGTIALRHEELVLLGSGVIGLGSVVDMDSPLAIHFNCSTLV